MQSRRSFLKTSALFGAGAALYPLAGCQRRGSGKLPFEISLAQWSFHRELRAGSMDNLDFAAKAAALDIFAIEYVNQFFADKARDAAYLAEMNQRAAGAGVRQLLIMIDGEGALGDADEAKRLLAVENHFKWIDAAQTLGCHSIRVNAGGQGTREEVAARCVDSLGALATYAQTGGLNVIVENHGGYSSDGAWLAGVMAEVKMENCGTLPDFGNFCIRRERQADGTRVCLEEYDRYQGVEELMPYAKAVSAKSHAFDGARQRNPRSDYFRMMEIVVAAGYDGYRRDRV
jgi:hypothetical protein